jgi:hypothetical protein
MPSSNAKYREMTHAFALLVSVIFEESRVMLLRLESRLARAVLAGFGLERKVGNARQ